MSSYKAIAAVSSSLRKLLEDRMEDPVAITIAPPDVAVSGITGRRLNLYLFQLLENAALKNQDLFGRSSLGEYGRPPLALDLRYLLTAFPAIDDAADADREAQEILGDAMRVLHDYAILTPNLHQNDDPQLPTLLDPELLGTAERLKVTLQPTALDELSKIWTAIPEGNFRRSIVYEVATVQIESRLARRVPGQVKERRVVLGLAERPQLDRVLRLPAPGTKTADVRLKLGQTLLLEGRRFSGTKTWVRLGNLEPIGVEPIHDGRIEVIVPDDFYPVDFDHPAPRPIPLAHRLQPGAQRVEVLKELELEGVGGGLSLGATVSQSHNLASSTLFFQLVPEIVDVQPSQSTSAGTLTVTGKRLFHAGASTRLLVGDVALPAAPSPVPTPTEIKVSLAFLAQALPAPPPAGQDYPLRLEVDGVANLEEGFVLKLLP